MKKIRYSLGMMLMLFAIVCLWSCENEESGPVIPPSDIAGSTATPDYEIWSKQTYTKDEYGQLLLNEFMKYIGDGNPSVKTLTQIYLKSMMSSLPKEAQFTVVNYDFTSRLTDNSEARLSGQIIVPTLGNKLLKETLVIDNRFTQLKDEDVPTKKLNVGATIATTGCPVVTCDMLGYGSSRDKTLNYHCHHLTSRHTVDAALAGLAVLHDDLGLDISKEALPVYNEGYSQGGYGALSVLKYMETQATDFEKRMLPITKTVCGAGAYDPTRMMQVIIDRQDEEYPYYCYLAAAFITTFEYHKKDYVSADDPSTPLLAMTDIFSPKAYAAGIVDMVESRQYGTGEISRLFTQKMDGECRASDVLGRELLDTHSLKYTTLMEKGQCESLVVGWRPKSRLHFYHAANDEAVPVECAQLARQNFGNGAKNNVTYDIDTEVTKLLDMAEVKGLQPHTVGYFNFIVQTVLDDLKK